MPLPSRGNSEGLRLVGNYLGKAKGNKNLDLITLVNRFIMYLSEWNFHTGLLISWRGFVDNKV